MSFYCDLATDPKKALRPCNPNLPSKRESLKFPSCLGILLEETPSSMHRHARSTTMQ